MNEELSDVNVALSNYVGQKVAVLCNRYQYRGVFSQVIGDGLDRVLVLANATAVEASGPSSGDTPNTEDPIGGSVLIPYQMVELVYQPNWSQAPLPGER